MNDNGVRTPPAPAGGSGIALKDADPATGAFAKKLEEAERSQKSSPGQHASGPVNRKVNHINKQLERKHSSGDLHSRLKTRKLLGVGETDDGDVHRSKLSQILGHSEQLFVKIPRGLRLWQIISALAFTVIGFWAIFLPKHIYETVVYRSTLDSVPAEVLTLPVRLYGGAVLSMSVFFWASASSVDRSVIRWSLLLEATYFIIQISVTCVTLYETGKLTSHIFRLIPHRLIALLGSVYYYRSCAERAGGVRVIRSSSTKDLSCTDGRASPTHRSTETKKTD